jgi:hypothetical protein
MPPPNNLGNILTSFLELCPEFVHEGLWETLPVSGDIRRPPPDPAAVVSELQQQYSQADLVKAGVLVMNSPESVELNFQLCDPETLIIALRKTDNAAPHELLTNQGTLSARELPICACLRDGRIQKQVSATKENVLFVADSTHDMAVLLSLELPATISSGLAHLGEPYLEQVRERFQLYPPPPKSRGGIIYHEDEQKQPPPDLLFAGFVLAPLSAHEPPDLVDIASHLADVEEHLQVPLDRFYLWSPNKKKIEGIVFQMEYASPEKVRTAILDDIEDSTRQLTAPRNSNDMPKDLPTAIKQMAGRLCDRQRDQDWERRAWDNIQRLLETSSIASMFKAAEDAENPIEKNLWMMAATNGHVGYPQALQMVFQAIRDTREHGPAQVSVLPREAFQQQIQRNAQQLKIFKEIRECRKNSYRAWKKSGF